MVEEKELEEKKSMLMTVKDFLTVSDARAILAFMVVLGGFIIIALSMICNPFEVTMAIMSTMVSLMMTVLGFYFHDKHKEDEE